MRFRNFTVLNDIMRNVKRGLNITGNHPSAIRSEKLNIKEHVKNFISILNIKLYLLGEYLRKI